MDYCCVLERLPRMKGTVHLLTAVKVGLILAALFSNAGSDPVRVKRQGSRSQYKIDTLVVVDTQMYSWFQQWLLVSSNVPRAAVDAKLKEYVSLVIHQVNARYEAINDLHYSISFQLVNVTLNENILDSLYGSSNPVDPQTALDTFKTWLQGLPRGNYDHAILLTGYTLGDPNAGAEVKGRAYVGKLCDPSGLSASIVQEDGGFQSAHYIAHELGHSKDCLSSNMTPMPEFTATANVSAGELYSADVQCQMLNGPTSRTCLGSGFSNLSDICTSMFCQESSKLTSSMNIVRCRQYFAAEGTSCGDMKICRLGRCVHDNNAPAVKECQNGDSLYLINSHTCAEEVQLFPGICYNETVKTDYCCSSCLSATRPSPGCTFGDKVTGCDAKNCGRTRDNGELYDEDCCGTCSNATTSSNSNSCQEVTEIDGMSCSERVTAKGVQGCYNATVATRCCLTCSRKLTSIPGCQFGDYYLGSFCSNTKESSQQCLEKKQDCCYSCRSYSMAVNVQWFSLTLSAVLLLGRVIQTVQ